MVKTSKIGQSAAKNPLGSVFNDYKVNGSIEQSNLFFGLRYSLVPIGNFRVYRNHPVKEVVWVFQRSVNAPQNGGNVATNDWLMLANKNQCFKTLVSVY